MRQCGRRDRSDGHLRRRGHGQRGRTHTPHSRTHETGTREWVQKCEKARERVGNGETRNVTSTCVRSPLHVFWGLTRARLRRKGIAVATSSDGTRVDVTQRHRAASRVVAACSCDVTATWQDLRGDLRGCPHWDRRTIRTLSSWCGSICT